MEWLLLCGIAGFLFHSLIKLKSLQDDAIAANLPFNWKRDYLVKDIFGILSAFVAPFIWLLLFSEVANKYPALHDFARVSFFVMGAFGSYILQLLLGKSKKYIRKVVDEKTNIADGITKDE